VYQIVGGDGDFHAENRNCDDLVSTRRKRQNSLEMKRLKVLRVT
jgi:hypothetical protein